VACDLAALLPEVHPVHLDQKGRGPALQVWDLSLLKRIPVRESKQVEFRAEFFNVMNNVNFNLPDGDSTVFGRPQFGTLLGAERARIIQFGLKFRY